MKPLERTSLQTSRKFFPFQGWGKKDKKESILRLKVYLKMVHITRKKCPASFQHKFCEWNSRLKTSVIGKFKKDSAASF